MAWRSYLPDSPERLSTVESWLYLTIFIFGVLTTVTGYIVVQVRSYRASLEKKQLETQLTKSEQELSATKLQLEEARKDVNAARKDAEDIRHHLTPRDLSSEQRRMILILV